MLGFSYDWQRELSTTEPAYYKWTQWIFTQLLEKDLAYQAEARCYPAPCIPAARKHLACQAETRPFLVSCNPARMPGHQRSKALRRVQVPVNWCPELGTVLANEEVIDGVSERGGFPVVRMPMKQWMLRITAYADRLLDDLEGLDWPESIKEMQRNWIGRSEGADITFKVRPSL